MGPRPPPLGGFTITFRHTIHFRIPLDERSVRRRDLYLTTHKHSQDTDINAPGGIGTQDPSKRSAKDPRLRPGSPWKATHRPPHISNKDSMVKQSLYRPGRAPGVPGESEFHRRPGSRHTKVVRSSALCNGRLYPPPPPRKHS
jgi:hypothetical protein